MARYLFHDLRARGRVLSQVDMVLVALARSMNATDRKSVV